jgi:hypothetical protein
MRQPERFERAVVVLVGVQRCAAPAVEDFLEAKLLRRVKLVHLLYWLLAHGASRHKKDARSFSDPAPAFWLEACYDT